MKEAREKNAGARRRQPLAQRAVVFHSPLDTQNRSYRHPAMPHAKKILAAFFFCLMSAAFCSGSDSVANLKRDTKNCADAWNRGDYPAFIGYLSERIVTDAKTRDGALAEIKQSFGYLESLGLKTLQVSVGDPGEVKAAGALRAAVVPVLAVMEGPEGKITAHTHVLAVSKDSGDKWTFFILYQSSQSRVDDLFPEFEKKLVIPSTIPPVIEPKTPALPATRTVRDETGRIKMARAGILTKPDGKETAFIILETTIGVFSFSSDDLRQPKEIVAAFDSVTDIISKRQYLPETNVDFTISVHYWTRPDWSRDTTPQQMARFNFENPKFLSPDQNEDRIRQVRDFWVRGLSAEIPKENFRQLVQKPLDVRFRYLEVDERNLSKSYQGP